MISRIKVYPVFRNHSGQSTMYEGRYRVIKSHTIGPRTELQEIELETPVLYTNPTGSMRVETKIAHTLTKVFGN